MTGEAPDGREGSPCGTCGGDWEACQHDYIPSDGPGSEYVLTGLADRGQPHEPNPLPWDAATCHCQGPITDHGSTD